MRNLVNNVTPHLIIPLSIVCCLLTIPSFSAASVFASDFTSSIMQDKPDLIITDVKVLPGPAILEQNFECEIKNIGTATIYEPIPVLIQVRRCYLGIIPGPILKNYTVSANYAQGLQPGAYIDIGFGSNQELPGFGNIGFFCVVNTGNVIDELFFDNNRYLTINFVFFGFWPYTM